MGIQIAEQTYNKAIICAQDDIVVLKGDIDQNKPEVFLEPFFRTIREQMGDALTLDLKNLNFFNSSAISCLVDFLMYRQPNTKITILIDKSRFWQKMLIEVVQSIDEENIQVEMF